MILTRRALLTGSLLLTLPRLSHAQTWQVTNHPLNDRATCEGWWLTTPDLMPHAWRDLVHGRLGAMSTPGIWRRMSPRRGSFGELVFQGTGATVVLPNFLDNPTTLSLSLWVRSTTTTRQALITKMPSYSGNLGWYLIIHTGGWLGFWVQENGSTAYAGVHGDVGDEVTDGLWHHVVATMAGWTGAQMSLTVDGQPYGAADPGAGTVTTISNSEPVRLGVFGDDSDPASAALDDVRFYNRVLNAAGIRLLRTAPWQQYRDLFTPAPMLAFAPAVPTAVRGPGLFLQ